MAFSQANITEVRVERDDADLLVRWSSSDAAGTPFQVYVDRRLAWHGTQRSCTIPAPHAAGNVPIDVGAVAAGEEALDLSGSLPAVVGTGGRARPEWEGGTFLDAEIESFHVYMGATPGGAVSYAEPVATITAYPQGIYTDGFGRGGFGRGGFGRSASVYAWTSLPLGPGTWNFGVKPVDSAGNEGTATTGSVAISVPPRPPAASSSGVRLTYTYNASTRVVTLNWLASPG